MQQRTQRSLSLSSILEILSKFKVERTESFQQLYIARDLADGCVTFNDSFFDMTLNSRTEYLHLFLLAVYSLAEGVLNGVSIVEDMTGAEWPAIFQQQNYEEIKSELHEWGIATEAEVPTEVVRSLHVYYQKDFQVLDQIDPEITDVFVYTSYSTSSRRAIVSKYASLCKSGSSFALWNASLASEEEYTASFSKIEEIDGAIVLDGSTRINDESLLLLMCHDSADELPSAFFSTLYEWLKLKAQTLKDTGKTPVVYITKQHMELGDDDLMNAEDCRITKYLSKYSNEVNISQRLATVLALFHIVSGVTVEFVGFTQVNEDRYLVAVKSLMNQSAMSAEQRIRAFDAMTVGDLYFVMHKNMICPAVLKSKTSNLSIKAFSLVKILGWLGASKVNSVRMQMYADAKDKMEPDISLTSIADLQLFDMQKMLQMIAWMASKCETTACVQWNSLSRLEECIYLILRLLEQKLYDNTHLLSLADLVLFTKDNTVYLGVLEMHPKYETKTYYNMGGWQSFEQVKSELLPGTIISTEGEANKDWRDLLGLLGHIDAGRMQLTKIEESLLLQAACLSPSRSVAALLKNSSMQLSDVDTIILTFTHLENRQVREKYWTEINRYFTSFGLECTDVFTGPINIYGGFNKTGGKISIYPVSFEDRPRRSSV